MADSVRALVDDVLGPAMTRKVWTGGYDKVLPATPQDYELSAVLPAVFYMFRFGVRRGPGKFLDTFGDKDGTPSQRRRSATVERIANRLSSRGGFDGFDGPIGQGILADLLLCFCLENVRHSQGRDQQVQRIGPAHYMASWVDLPHFVAHLRGIPEMIVSILADQNDEIVKVSEKGERTWFPVGWGYENNVLLRAFNQGVTRRSDILEDRASDQFDETNHKVGLDQLVTIRLAATLESAPLGVPGRDASRISNQRPLAETAARNFAEDIRRFLRAYSQVLPRHTLVDTLEACIAVGMTTVLSSLVRVLLEWANTGCVPSRLDQEPEAVLVDCSNGVDRRIRDCAEQSMDDVVRRMERIPDVLMALRLLDYHATLNKKIQDKQFKPYATNWLNLFGDLLHKRHEEAHNIHYSVAEKAEGLGDRLAFDRPDVASILRNSDSQSNPVWRLAHGLTTLMGPGATRRKFVDFVDSSLLTDRPNGIATKRKATRVGRRRDIRSIVFTDAALEYLVHLHLLPSANRLGVRKLAYREFIDTLRTRYGFCIDTAPPGMSISNELLQRNCALLERRLRDLGLLVGVNDADAMKRLRPRFQPDQAN